MCGNVAVIRQQVPDQRYVVRFLRDGRSAERDRQRLHRIRIDYELIVDAIAQHAVAGNRYELIDGVRLELTVARVELLRAAVRTLQYEEAVTLDGEVERIGADLNCTLRKVRSNFRHADTQADLPWVRAAARRARPRPDALSLQKLRGE